MVSERDNLTVLLKIQNVIPNILQQGLSIYINVILRAQCSFMKDIYCSIDFMREKLNTIYMFINRGMVK